MNINPRTLLQCTEFKSVKDLNLKLIPLPVYTANTFLRKTY